jgi:hypothetical protein
MKNYASQKFAELVADDKMNKENPVGTGSLIMNGKSRDVGVNSVSIGNNTIAKADYSYTEGNNTIASSINQHVQGKFNIEDPDNTYAHIVGNGTSDSKRSNAHTLDWNGVGWFQGGLQVGGNAQDDDAKNVVLEGMPQNYIILKDIANNCEYVIKMQNGNLISVCKTSSIAVTSLPTKKSYLDGESFDTAGMVVTATCQDGTTKIVNNYTYTEYVLNCRDVVIFYEDAGTTYTTTISANNFIITPFDPAVHLIDFNYTENDDGTYTITSWKQTLNGESSTEMIIPNSGLIRL